MSDFGSYPRKTFIYAIIKRFGITDGKLLKYMDSWFAHPFGTCLKELTITTATLAYDSNIRMDYKELSEKVGEPEGLILAVKSPHIPIEKLLDNEYTKARSILNKRKRKKNRSKNAIVKNSRATTGNGIYFQSSVEYVVGPKSKYYNVRISPKGGSIQIQGVNGPVYKNGDKYVKYVLDHIAEKLEVPQYEIENRRNIIINSKTEFISDCSYLKINQLSKYIQQIIEGEESPIHIPYKIVFVTNYEEIESFIMIKFATPIEKNPERKTSVKVFSGKKINILGAACMSTSLKIYRFLDELFDYYKDEITVVKRKSKDKLSTIRSKNYVDWTSLF